jgi:hypothetical protein
MSEYDFILDNMKFSYSSVNTYNTCPYGFKLTYIDYEDRSQNWYADFGSFVHLVMEKYFGGELEPFELAKFFEDNFGTISSPPPPYPPGIADKYYARCLEFFENFEFDKSDYEIIGIEDALETTFQGIKLVVKPDLILHNKKTGENILLDYKTSDPFKNGKPDKKKIGDYWKQLYLYAYFIWNIKNIEINKMKLWFIRVGRTEEETFDPVKAQEIIDWFVGEIGKIKKEDVWKANNENKFFCQMLCSVSKFCPHKP